MWGFSDVVWEWPKGPGPFGVWYGHVCEGRCRALGVQIWRLTLRIVWHIGPEGPIVGSPYWHGLN